RLFDMSLYILDILPTTRSTLFPYTTLFRSIPREYGGDGWTGSRLLEGYEQLAGACLTSCFILSQRDGACRRIRDSGNAQLCQELDRKSTRLNSSHEWTSYAVFCLKKKKINI